MPRLLSASASVRGPWISTWSQSTASCTSPRAPLLSAGRMSSTCSEARYAWPNKEFSVEHTFHFLLHPPYPTRKIGYSLHVFLAEVGYTPQEGQKLDESG